MGTGSSRIGKAFCAAVMAVTLSQAPAASRELKTGIWKVMRDAGDTNRYDDEESRVWPIGNMDVGRWHYRFMAYAWEQSERNMVPGGAQHAGYRLLMFERTKKGLAYLGSYETWGGRPKIKGRTLVFPYKDPLGMHVDRTVTFDEKGPPSQIFLDGMVFPFWEAGCPASGCK
jgi:hypothetical protein